MEMTMQTWWALRKNLISRPYVPDGDVEPSQVQVVFYADVQAMVEALQRQVAEGIMLREDLDRLRRMYQEVLQRVEALRRELEHAKKMEAVQKEVADNQTWHVRDLRAAIDAEREKVPGYETEIRNAYKEAAGWQTQWKHAQHDLSQLQALVRAVKPYVASWLEETYGDEYVHHPEWKQLEAATLDATPPAQTEEMLEFIRKKGGDGE